MIKKITYLLIISSLCSCFSSNPISNTKITKDNKIKQISKQNESVKTIKTITEGTIIILPLDSNADKSKFQIPEVKKDNITNTEKYSNNINFNISKPIKEGVRNAHITIFFEDNKKIRLTNFGENTFKSLSNYNTENLNKIIKKYDIKKIEANESVYLQSEEDLSLEEKLNEKKYNKDYPNKGSIYNMYAENIDVKGFINELKNNELVLSVNENNG
jgi:hypothetical protein